MIALQMGIRGIGLFCYSVAAVAITVVAVVVSITASLTWLLFKLLS